MNQEQSIVILTLWNNVTESEGGVIDENDEDFPIIRASNRKSQKLAVSAKDHFTHSDSLLDVPTNKICAIADVVADNRVDKFLVRVQAMVTDPDQKFFYMSCEKCFSGVDADFDYPYTCASWKEFTHAKPREKILFNIFDGSGSLDVTAFGKHSTELTGMSASSCMELYNGAPFPLESINRSLSGQHYIMKIRKRERYMGDSMHHQYVVLNMLFHKPMDNVGCSTAITDATLSVSRELFPPGTYTNPNNLCKHVTFLV
ncbi:hypothetical protein ACJIZ3_012481 [Penstemon smallii]|uniref:Replication factor A C-terminal domain-containing protein n=1 Tax=Penstemon smallii TaxID=265156 RepID=A0ABD3UM85_9LAMI